MEPDVIRRADNLLYILNQYRGLTIVDLDSEELLSQSATVGYPRDLYLIDNTAYVLVSYAQDVRWDEKGRYQVSYGSRLYVFDVSDPEAVRLIGSQRFEGDLIDSRLVGTILYAVCSNYTWYYPLYTDETIATESTDKSYGDTWAISLNTADPENITTVNKVQFEGYGNLIQATNKAIFCATNDWNEDSTWITYVDIDDPDGKIEVRGTALVKGQLADRFKMDAWNDVLRVVSNTGWRDRRTLITTFDLKDPDTFQQIGYKELESATGDTTYATRFDGDRAYIVTYLTVDPLYVVDLKDPYKPDVLGELEIPGWSTHIEPRGDRLIALGVDDTDGRRKVMVSLFDVADPEDPQRLDWVSFGDDWSWSTAYEDVKAFAILGDMILVPFSGWNSGSGGYDRVQFVSCDQDSLEAHNYVDLQGSAIRSITYDGLYFTITQEQLAVINADNPKEPEIINHLALAENVVDAIPLEEGWIAEVICRYDSADSIVRAVNDEIGYGTPVTLKTSSISESFLWKDKLILVASGYDYYPEYTSFYRVFIVDFSNPAHPLLEKDIAVKLDPWYYYGWMDYDYDYDYARPGSDKMIRPYYPYYYYYDNATTAFLVGDHVVLRGMASHFDLYLGGSSAYQGLALLNLNDPESPQYLGLADTEITDINSDGYLLYLTSRKSLTTTSGQHGLCAYYLSTLNPATLERTQSVNVPGIFQHRVPGSSTLILKDSQYRQDGSVKEILRSGLLSKTQFELQDSINLPFNNTQLIASGDFICYTGYLYSYYQDDIRDTLQSTDDAAELLPQNGYILGGAFVNERGEFSSHARKNVGEVWCTLLGAHKGSAFLSVSGAAAAQWNFNTEEPKQDSLIPVMGYPTKIRFGKDQALIPLGYGGVATFPL